MENAHRPHQSHGSTHHGFKKPHSPLEERHAQSQEHTHSSTGDRGGKKFPTKPRKIHPFVIAGLTLGVVLVLAGSNWLIRTTVTQPEKSDIVAKTENTIEQRPLSAGTTIDINGKQKITMEAIVLEVVVPEQKYLVQMADGSRITLEVTDQTLVTREQATVSDAGAVHYVNVLVEREKLASLHTNSPIKVSYNEEENSEVIQAEQLALLQ